MLEEVTQKAGLKNIMHGAVEMDSQRINRLVGARHTA